MAQLHIVKLKCVKKDDPGVDKDEAILKVSGTTLSGPHKLGRGDEIALNAKHSFTGSVQLSLTEEDRGKDDALGTFTIRDTDGKNNRTADFDALAHAYYEATYHIDD